MSKRLEPVSLPPLADLCAGWAVGRGALLAGELLKRSSWKHEWNSRFFVLTVEELVWCASTRTDQMSCASWRFATGGERRATRIRA